MPVILSDEESEKLEKALDEAYQGLIEELYKVEGQAEIINLKIVTMPPHGGLVSEAIGGIVISLHVHAKRTGQGYAIGSTVGFLVNLPCRKSFCPDAAFWIGAKPTMKFFDGAPIFAVEVRSENDYGPKAERAITQKRADYFDAGTLVVWDVDLLSDDIVKCYRAADPQNPRVFRRGDIADAEPAVPGWSMPVDDLFP